MRCIQLVAGGGGVKADSVSQVKGEVVLATRARMTSARVDTRQWKRHEASEGANV